MRHPTPKKGAAKVVYDELVSRLGMQGQFDMRYDFSIDCRGVVLMKRCHEVDLEPHQPPNWKSSVTVVHPTFHRRRGWMRFDLRDDFSKTALSSIINVPLPFP